MSLRTAKFLVLLGGLVAAGNPAAAGVLELGLPFADHAVLQRDKPVPVWGTAAPGETVSVSFAGQVKTAVADAKGAWRVILDPMPASKEGRTLSVTATSNLQPSTSNLDVADVLVGEVWFASGQSNMRMPIWGPDVRFRDANGALLAEMTELPNIRYSHIERLWETESEPGVFHYRDRGKGAVGRGRRCADWRTLTSANLRQPGEVLSAVAFYYARELYLALDVPIGIVDASWGGTNIDAWTPRCAYAECNPSLKAVADYPVKANFDKEKDRCGPINCAQNQPTVLFNGMVAPWTPMAMRGVIWYQGCTNARESELYYAKMCALYDGWRRMFAFPDMSFYLVQLAPYKTSWMGIVDAQNRFVRDHANTALAVISDLGNFADIHPNTKETVAKRLVVHALKRNYGFDIPEDDSPVLRSARFADGKAELTFDHVRSWYVYAPDRSLEPAFELAGTNGVWETAKIANLTNAFVTGSTLVLASEKVSDPVKARYLGRPQTMGTVYNEVSLPLGAFETK